MKKILMATIVLLSFALALALTEASCSKSNAQASIISTTPTPVGLVLYEGDNNTTPGIVNFYICNYDGSNAHQIPVPNLPMGFTILEGGRLSPDGKTLFLLARDMSQSPGAGGTYPTYLYSVGIDGSNLKQLATVPANSSYDAAVQGAY
jgi:hypothetical protein